MCFLWFLSCSQLSISFCEVNSARENHNQTAGETIKENKGGTMTKSSEDENWKRVALYKKAERQEID